MNRLAAGAGAGALATAHMSLFMEGSRAIGGLDREPPEIITANVEATTGTAVAPELSFDERWKLVHLAFGMGMGAVFGALRTALPRNTAAAGLLFGAGLWSVMYGAALPAARLYPPVDEDWKPRTLTIVLAHLLYGLTLAGTFDAAHRRR
jgi:hypothetical protein